MKWEFLFLAAAPAIASAQPAWFMPVGDLPGGYFFSSVADLSADGQTAVGGSAINNAFVSEGAFSWTQADGLTYLGDFDGGYEQSAARAISPDGATIVGYGRPTTQGGVAMTYNVASGAMTNLGDLPGATEDAEAFRVSNQGRVVVGRGTMTNGRTGFRWTAETGMQPLTPLGKFGNTAISTAWGVSADGTITVGESTVPGGWAAVLWREDGTVQTLPRLHTEATQTFAFGISDNGRFVGGRDSGYDSAKNEGFENPVIWDLLTGENIRLDTDDDPYVGGRVNDVSDDGNIAIGTINIGIERTASFIWFRDRGLVIAEDYFKELGFDVFGSRWGFMSIRSMTPDGRFVAGSTSNPDGFTEGFVARIPAPSGAATLAGLFVLAATRRSSIAPASPTSPASTPSRRRSILPTPATRFGSSSRT